MREHRFDVITRGAAHATSRRGSLLTLAGAALAATVAGPSLAEAKKKGKNKKNDKKCKRQDEQCAAFFADHCEKIECESEELAAALECCLLLRKCHAGAYLACLFDLIAPTEPQ